MEDLEERLDDLSQKIEDTYDDIADNWNELSERQKRKVKRFRIMFLSILNDELGLIEEEERDDSSDKITAVTPEEFDKMKEEVR